MFFVQDLFAVHLETWSHTANLNDDDIQSAIDLALELVKPDAEPDLDYWEGCLGLLRSASAHVLHKDPSDSTYQRFLCIAAYVEAVIAQSTNAWCLASDWLLTAMARCSKKNEPTLSRPLAENYLLTCAAMASGSQALEYELTQLHVQLDKRAFDNVSTGYVRLSALGSDRIKEAIRRAPNLRTHITDRLWKAHSDSKERRRAETDIVSVTYQQAAQLLRDASREVDTISALSAITSSRSSATRLIKKLSACERFLLSEERESIEGVRDVLGPCLTHVSETDDNVDIKKQKDAFEAFISHATTAITQGSSAGLFYSLYCLPPIRHLQRLAIRESGFAEEAIKPNVVLKQTTKRYPLDQVGETIAIQVEVLNDGRGRADDIHVTFTCIADTVTCLRSTSLAINTLAPGRSATLECPIQIEESLDALALSVDLTCLDMYGHEIRQKDTIVIERQRAEPDWDELLYSRPYALEPVSSLSKLRGRTAILDTLKLNVAGGMSSVIWGQKRVGKTSISLVFFNEIVDKSRFITIYLRRGDVAGYSEGQIAHTLASRIAAEVPDLSLQVPDQPWFGSQFTRLTDWLIRAQSSGLKKQLLIILDEFDEINPAIYLGDRGNNFFATLRSLTEHGIIWIFVGSERMQNIFLRHHATLNKVHVLKVDRVIEPRDIDDMIVGPVRGKLDWDTEAVDIVREFSAGNPYYAHLVCQRILRSMYSSRRTFVDAADVTIQAGSIASEQTPTHWGHFWEDNSELSSEARSKKAAYSALLLAGIGACGEQVALTSSMITKALTSYDIPIDEATKSVELLPELTQRGVLQELHVEDETRYQVTIPLFWRFLIEHSRSEVLPYYHHHLAIIASTLSDSHIQSVTGPRADTFPVDESDLIAISDGLFYQGKPIDAIRIKDWLRQFPDEGAILLAAKLLTRLKEKYYFDHTSVSHAVREGHRWLADYMASHGHKITQNSGGRIINVYVSYIGESTKSGADVAREFKTQQRYANAGAIDKALRWITDYPNQQGIRFVTIVDDFVGTGNHAKTEILSITNTLRKNAELLDWAKSGHLLFNPLWAFVDGADSIKREIGDLVRVEPIRYLDDEDKAFSPNNNLFSNEDERRYAEEVFRHIGQQLSRDHPLGWENTQALVVFENTVPNNTLTAIWKDGIVDEKQWKALFPRP